MELIPEEKKVVAKDYSSFGLAITIIYVVVIFIVLVFRRCEFMQLDLNELGDFLAGVFGPVALLWLALGAYQQREAINLQAEELRNQVKELRNSVKQQAKLVEVNKEMIQIETNRYADEKKPKINITFGNVFLDQVSNTISIEVILNNYGYLARTVRLQCIQALGNPTFATFDSLPNFNNIAASFRVHVRGNPILLTVMYYDGLHNQTSDYYRIAFLLNDSSTAIETIHLSQITEPDINT